MARRPKIRPHEINVPVAAISSPAAAISSLAAAINVPVAASASEPTKHRRASQGAVTPPLSFPARPRATAPFCCFFRGLRGSQRPRRSGRQHISSLAAAINVPVAASASEPTNHRRASQGAVTPPVISRPPTSHRAVLLFLSWLAWRAEASPLRSPAPLATTPLRPHAHAL